jgi:hypothetical protein
MKQGSFRAVFLILSSVRERQVMNASLLALVFGAKLFSTELNIKIRFRERKATRKEKKTLFG